MGSVSFAVPKGADSLAIRAWARFIHERCDALSVQVESQKEFRGSFASFPVGENQFCLVTAGRQNVVRTPGSGREAVPRYHLIYVLNGSLQLESPYRKGDVAAGDWVLLPNHEYFSFVTSEDCSCAVVHFSTRWLRSQLPVPEQLLDRQMSRRAGWHDSFRYFLEALSATPEYRLARDAPLALEQLPRLLALACDAGMDGASQSQSSLLHAILSYLRTHHADLDLDLDHVAHYAGVSRRYVSAVLARHGTSFSKQLMRIRLERAADMLRSAPFRQTRVGDIALSVGLQDQVHFAKRFRAQYGTTPTKFRGN